uniref:Lipoxygenase domain-containing protein n=1 Tax=Hucho hucho TaxID=62062 RepID=A0A4W5QXK5_9TELE
MLIYTVKVFTGEMPFAGTKNSVYIKLVGTNGESERTYIPKTAKYGSVKPYCLLGYLNNEWFCSKVVVTTPEGDTANFPCYHWISSYVPLMIREATGQYVGVQYRSLCRFSFERKKELQSRQELLNGLNPMMIRRCSKIPENFPVTEDMVKDSLFEKNLEEEIQKGNIFLVDYKSLHGAIANVINKKQHFLAAPLCLLYMTPEDKLMPIAIQLKQEPGDDNPIFLPTDSEYDWLLAKIFVRSADFTEHELNFHLLRTHLLAEVFAVSTLRNLPMVHPLYKLLSFHFRYTLQINTLARQKLISENGLITENAGIGGPGMIEFLKKAVASLTYSSLCLPEDIAERGLESIPNFFYKEDGLKLWDIIHRFVQKVIGHYYTCDSDVQKDSELQNWIKDIFFNGFLKKDSTGIPQSFSSVTELVKFLTMVIFTVSVQHSAVNSGQFDFGGWMPNFPIALQKQPPNTKGQSTEKTMLETFPDVNTTVNGIATVFLLSKQSTDFVALGHGYQDLFSEKTILQLIRKFQDELKIYSFEIQGRNVSLPLPYTYLNPNNVENSVAL